MYRSTKNDSKELQQIVDIYNSITGRNRTVEQHRWEWFKSPYENKSYVMVKGENEIIGHHGILTIELNHNGKVYRAGKTENTIAKKGFGAAYPKNEMAMFKEYSSEYDLLITTAAWGVTKRLREKIGYKFFAKNLTLFRVIDASILASRFNNAFMKGAINLMAKPVNLLMRLKLKKYGLDLKLKDLDYNDLESIEDYYDKCKVNLGFTQIRNRAFLEYRFLNNPYSNFSLATISEQDQLKGYVVFQVQDENLFVEDVLSSTVKDVRLIMDAFVSLVNKHRLAKVVIFTTLENSLLDQSYRGFFRRRSKDESPCVMYNVISSDKGLEDIKVDNMYFTRLTNEGVL